MPFYQFLIHGLDPQVADDQRGFFTTRHAFAASEAEAAAEVLRRLAAEFEGDGERLWSDAPPVLAVETAERIGWFRALTAPNRGCTFYDERDAQGDDLGL